VKVQVYEKKRIISTPSSYSLYFSRKRGRVSVAIFQFGDFRLDCGQFELCRKGRRLKLERQPLELLILLATKGGQIVTRDEIAKCLWESDVFVDTEHGINTAIRKIRQALGEDKEQPRFVQTVSGQGYRFIAPLVIVSASPETQALGAIPAAEPSVSTTSESAQLSQSLQRKLWLALGSGIAVAALILAVTLDPQLWIERLLRRTAQPVIASLAVLPLDNLSGDPAQEYFADGMTDELITMLAKNSTIHITSRTSVMQYKGVHRPLREIARELGVDGILEGSISRSANKVHMTIQLIQATTDTHLWAESYDRDASEVAALPTEAAQAIAKKLNSSVPSASPARYISPEAHDAYLRGRYLWFAGENDKAGEYFKKATELQPDYALGWSGLANYYGAGAIDGDLDPKASLALEEAAAAKSVELDDSLPEAHLSLGAAMFTHQWNWDRSQQEVDRAIQLDPKYSEAYHFLAKILATLNRHQEAIEAQKKATELDPFARPWALAYSYQLARQYDLALTEAHQRLAANGGDVLSHWVLYETYRCKGMSKEATEELEKQLLLQGDEASAASIRRAYQQAGYKAVLYWQISSLQKKASTQYVSSVDLSLLYAQLGDRDHALSLLEEGFSEHSPLLLWIQCDPAYDFLHTDERYRSIIKRVGLPPAY
jgi:TolB-like protein/DNA-binding winged helix-turn-helix (wHTH) protein